MSERLLAAVAARGDEEPRTEHLDAEGRPLYTNRLILESSTYLRQHAHNPVDWYPWGEEAFERARREGRPVFLSIGYSTCHWCHVMERESFDDEAIARLLNESFVAIKVDREQRPDIDELYMTAVQVTTGRGGWPMSSFLTPEGKPFFGATYFPPADFTKLLERVVDAWRNERQTLTQSADRISLLVREVTAASGAAAELEADVLVKALDALLERHDDDDGGFGEAPKFPHESNWLLISRVLSQRQIGSERHTRWLSAMRRSLEAMARGGLFDQVGGGFHRYSTDAVWLVPHFEKMLYNQALMARVYARGYLLTADLDDRRVVAQTLDYVLREMTSPEGLFYSATDADSEGEEGRFFVWTPQEIDVLVERDDAALVKRTFGVTEQGNFDGRTILHRPRAWPEVADSSALPLAQLLARIDRARQRLLEARQKRVAPLRDEKVLTAWNGMMITGLVEGSVALGEDRYLEAAQRAGERLWQMQWSEQQGLLRLRLGAESSGQALQEDYAFLLEAFLALFEADNDRRWLERSRDLAEQMLERFWDDTDGGFFQGYPASESLLFARPKSPADGAVPSGNSVAVAALARLAAATGERRYRQRAEETIGAFASSVARRPWGYPYFLFGVEELLHGASGRVEYGAQGAVRAAGTLDGRRLEVTLDIRDGWHVNSADPGSETLIATRLDLGEWEGRAPEISFGPVKYPEGEAAVVPTQEQPTRVYSGQVILEAEVGVDATRILPLELRLQACDDERCLLPETLHLELPTLSREPEKVAP